MTNFDKSDQDAVLTQLVRAYVRDQKRNRMGRFLFRTLLIGLLGFI